MPPKLVAKAFIFNADGLVLTLRRSKTDAIRPLTWDLPGGGVDELEDPTDAVIREIKEEAGLDIKKPQVFTTVTSTDRKYVVRLLYHAHTDSTDVQLSYEHDEYQWITRDGLLQLDIPQYYKDSLQHLPV